MRRAVTAALLRRGGAMAAERWLFPLLSVAFVSLLLVLSAISGLTASSSLFARLPPPSSRRAAGGPPAFAYYISGGRGDGPRALRLLLAVYHPRNRYLLHLTAPDTDPAERTRLAAAARAAIPAIRAFGNVDVLGKPDAATYMGSSGLAATLHAASVLLRLDEGWNWFVTLSASDYPLVTQDDLSHVFSFVPRELNFIDHSSDLGWKENQRVQPIIVDPAIYLARRVQIFQASERRATPNAFKFFTGSPWVILSRPFLEYCILGWENLPRTLLLYFTNVMLSEEGYFHSVICNALEFKNTTVNNDLRYMVWDNPPGMQPHFLNLTDYDQMVESGVPFARHFQMDDYVLDKIDDKILGRWRHRAVPGAWCSGKRGGWFDPCSQWSNIDIVKPGPQSSKFGELMKKLLDDWKSQSNSCR